VDADVKFIRAGKEETNKRRERERGQVRSSVVRKKETASRHHRHFISFTRSLAVRANGNERRWYKSHVRVATQYHAANYDRARLGVTGETDTPIRYGSATTDRWAGQCGEI
jgi:hypothetical protein